MDLETNRLGVYRKPKGGEYSSTRSLTGSDAIAPLHFPKLTIRVEEILGQR